jgi:hypothetical protein
MVGGSTFDIGNGFKMTVCIDVDAVDELGNLKF